MFPVSMAAIWTAAIIVFLIVEGLTVGLTSVWFACGSLAALIAALFHLPLWVQLVLFFVVSGLALWLTRPLAKKYVNAKRQATNADRVFETVGRVTERIDNIAGTGLVHIDGKSWTARSASEAPIESGTLVRPVRIEGVKLIVEKAEQTAAVREEN